MSSWQRRPKLLLAPSVLHDSQQEKQTVKAKILEQHASSSQALTKSWPPTTIIANTVAASKYACGY